MHTQWLIGNEYGDYFFVANDKNERAINKLWCEKRKRYMLQEFLFLVNLKEK